MNSPVATAGVPELNFDPFSPSFPGNPFLDHARLRNAGPVVRLQRYGVYAAGRHLDVRAVLQDYAADQLVIRTHPIPRRDTRRYT